MATYLAELRRPRYQIRQHTMLRREWCVVDTSTFGLVRLGLTKEAARATSDDLNAWDRLGRREERRAADG